MSLGGKDQVAAPRDTLEDPFRRPLGRHRVAFEAFDLGRERAVVAIDPGDLDGADEGSPHSTGADEADADAVAAEVEAEHLGDAPQAELGRAVRGMPGEAEEARRRGDVDNVP